MLRSELKENTETENTLSPNQTAYYKYAKEHSQLSMFNSTKYLAYRDLPLILCAHLFNRHPEKKKFKIMDYGCGPGEPLGFVRAIFEEAGCEVEMHGVDINEANLAIAKMNNENVEFHLVKKGELVLDLNDFDLVICNFVLLENELADLNKILENINYLLSETGVAVVTHNRAKTYDKKYKFLSFNTDFPENQRDYFDEVKNKWTRADGKSVRKEVYSSPANFLFNDLFYRRRTYKQCFELAGLALLNSHIPLGDAEDKINWQCETLMGPYRIDVLRRNSERDFVADTMVMRCGMG